MKIRLLKDVEENGRLKTTIRRSRKQVIGWFEGTEMEVSDSTGQKMIDQKIAEQVTDPAPVEE